MSELNIDTAMKISREQGRDALYSWYENLSDKEKKEFRGELYKKIEPFIEIFGQMAAQIGIVARSLTAFYQAYDPAGYAKLQKKARAHRRYERRYNRIRKERNG